MKVVIVGFGAMAAALLPIMKSEFATLIKSMHIYDPSIEPETEYSPGFSTHRVRKKLTKENLAETLKNLDAESFLINLSVDVSSKDLVKLANAKGSLYIDTCIEPWLGHYNNPTLPLADRTNYYLREQILALRKELGQGPTAVIAHGANPGLVSHFVKRAMLHLYRDIVRTPLMTPQSKCDWAKLSNTLGIKVIHIAEHDTQIAKIPKHTNEFVNTWSVDGFISEGQQPAELGWGTHEYSIPDTAAHHLTGSKCAIFFDRPGAMIRVRTWTPAQGACLGYLITHNETISLAEYLSLYQDGALTYRPTVNYAYHPCNDAVLSLHELSGRSWTPQTTKRVLRGEDISEGADFLGVLLMGHEKNAYWYGSTLSNTAAQALGYECSATSMQVVAGLVSGMKWALANPDRGITEPEDMDFEFVLRAAEPYLGHLTGVYTNWLPGNDLYPKKNQDKWQFENFLE